jgi:hypothetical protein
VNKRIISAREAAKRIGCDAQTVRIRLRNGIWNFGRALPPFGETKQWTYEVYVERLEEYLKGK